MNLEKIRNTIERMDKIYQIDIFDIIKKNNIFYTENNNGIFMHRMCYLLNIFNILLASWFSI